MRFYEFELINPKHSNDLIDKGASSGKSGTQKTVKGVGNILGTVGKGLAKATGMFFKDFDPAMQDLIKTTDSDKSSKELKKTDGRQQFKKSLEKYLKNEYVEKEDQNNLKIGLSNAWFKDMEDPFFKSGLQKLIDKQTPNGKELVILKRVQSKIF